MLKLSTIILNYNTKDLLNSCLSSLEASEDLSSEIIVVDNASSDGSIELLEKLKSEIHNLKVVKNDSNLGFSKGNNSARNYVKGEYVLFLNSDTKVNKDTLKKSVNYLGEHPEVGALTCKIVLPSGELDKDARRAFPTPWVALTHLSGLDRIFPKSKLFSRYWYGYKDDNEINEVDALQGAYFLTRKKVLDQVGWFDEDYFLNGEDIDLSFKIRQKGWKIVYYPEVSILHIKKGTKRKRNIKNVLAGVNAMELFYKKHLFNHYPFYINMLVYMGLSLLRIIRTINYYILRS